MFWWFLEVPGSQILTHVLGVQASVGNWKFASVRDRAWESVHRRSSQAQQQEYVGTLSRCKTLQ